MRTARRVLFIGWLTLFAAAMVVVVDVCTARPVEPEPVAGMFGVGDTVRLTEPLTVESINDDGTATVSWEAGGGIRRERFALPAMEKAK